MQFHSIFRPLPFFQFSQLFQFSSIFINFRQLSQINLLQFSSISSNFINFSNFCNFSNFSNFPQLSLISPNFHQFSSVFINFHQYFPQNSPILLNFLQSPWICPNFHQFSSISSNFPQFSSTFPVYPIWSNLNLSILEGVESENPISKISRNNYYDIFNFDVKASLPALTFIISRGDVSLFSG